MITSRKQIKKTNYFSHDSNARNDSKINQLKEQLDNEIIEFMKENNLYSIKTDDISFTLVKPSTSETFDKKTFIKDNPTIDLSKYNKISERKGYLKTTLKK